MPLHEYECEKCGHRFEAIRKFSDPPLEVCPKCGGVVRKLVSAPAIQFKGSGWYVTDYAKKDSGAKPEGEKKTETKSGESSSTSTDTGKSETKTEKPSTKTDTPAA